MNLVSFDTRGRFNPCRTTEMPSINFAQLNKKINAGKMLEQIYLENPYNVLVVGDLNAHHKKWYARGRTDDFG